MTVSGSELHRHRSMRDITLRMAAILTGDVVLGVRARSEVDDSKSIVRSALQQTDVLLRGAAAKSFLVASHPYADRQRSLRAQGEERHRDRKG